MEHAEIIHLTAQALLLTLYLSLPTIVVAAAVGVLVSLLQALTQIQEQTLGFVLKLVAVILTILATAGWLSSIMMDYTLTIFDSFPVLVR